MEPVAFLISRQPPDQPRSGQETSLYIKTMTMMDPSEVGGGSLLGAEAARLNSAELL